MKKNLVVADSLDTIRDTDLVQTARNLLDSVVQSTDMMKIQEMTPKKLQEAKIVLGFLNATTNTIKTKMQFFKMVGIDNKIEAVKKMKVK